MRPITSRNRNQSDFNKKISSPGHYSLATVLEISAEHDYRYAGCSKEEMDAILRKLNVDRQGCHYVWIPNISKNGDLFPIPTITKEPPVEFIRSRINEYIFALLCGEASYKEIEKNGKIGALEIGEDVRHC